MVGSLLTVFFLMSMKSLYAQVVIEQVVHDGNLKSRILIYKMKTFVCPGRK